MTDSYKALLYTPHAQVCADYWRRRAKEVTDWQLQDVFSARAHTLKPIWGFEARDIMRSPLYEDWWTRALDWERPNTPRLRALMPKTDPAIISQTFANGFPMPQ